MKPYYQDDTVTLLHGDALEVAKTLPAKSIRTIVTSPPYFGLRDYGMVAQYGAESTVQEYVSHLVELFRELRKALTDDGTLWLNLGDSWASRWGSQRDRSQLHLPDNERNRRPPVQGFANKQLLMTPARTAIALQDDGWFLRSDVIWHKPNPMPEGVTDRPTKSHEHIFMLAKTAHPFFNGEAVAEQSSMLGRPQRERAEEIAAAKGLTEEHFAAIRSVGITDVGKARVTQAGTGRNGAAVQALADEAKVALGGYYREFLFEKTRNIRDVWTVATTPFGGAHFAVFPPGIPTICVRASSEPGDTVLDPFSGSGTTGMVATQEGRKYVGVDLNSKYLDLSLRTRFAQPALNFGAIS